jgi:hypothetical protein
VQVFSDPNPETIWRTSVATECIEGYSGVKLVADAANSYYSVIASVTTKRRG